MAGIAEGVIADLISKGVEKIASRKKVTSEDLTVFCSMSRVEALQGLNTVLEA